MQHNITIWYYYVVQNSRTQSYVWVQDLRFTFSISSDQTYWCTQLALVLGTPLYPPSRFHLGTSCTQGNGSHHVPKKFSIVAYDVPTKFSIVGYDVPPSSQWLVMMFPQVLMRSPSCSTSQVGRQVKYGPPSSHPLTLQNILSTRDCTSDGGGGGFERIRYLSL